MCIASEEGYAGPFLLLALFFSSLPQAVCKYGRYGSCREQGDFHRSTNGFNLSCCCKDEIWSAGRRESV